MIFPIKEGWQVGVSLLLKQRFHWYNDLIFQIKFLVEGSDLFQSEDWQIFQEDPKGTDSVDVKEVAKQINLAVRQLFILAQLFMNLVIQQRFKITRYG